MCHQNSVIDLKSYFDALWIPCFTIEILLELDVEN
jgi:hypothetical protein